jgi:hypothetical protein
VQSDPHAACGSWALAPTYSNPKLVDDLRKAAKEVDGRPTDGRGHTKDDERSNAQQRTLMPAIMEARKTGELRRSVEGHIICNHGVTGSNPVAGTNNCLSLLVNSTQALGALFHQGPNKGNCGAPAGRPNLRTTAGTSSGAGAKFTGARHTGYMAESTSRSLLELPFNAQKNFVAGARDTDPVRGLTHGYYKYPARFSPAFVRATLETFTRPGDLVLDNHVGGGTTLVEALASGRHSIGVDISTLAEFVATVKTTVYSEAELDRLDAWSKRVADAIGIRKPGLHFEGYAELGYYKHLDHPSRWRLRKSIEQGLRSAIRMWDRRLENFGRCAVLRTAQWALDGRKKLPNIDEFRDFLEGTAIGMVAGARALRAAVKANGPHRPSVTVINRSAAGMEDDERLQRWKAPRLVLTSPPYPGVHVLYHRWQVDGRKEASAPFWIAGKLDGAGSSYYTMGDRKYPELATYFANIKATMSSVAALADEDTFIVQMVAFSDAEWQLKRYLETMREAGLEKVFLPLLESERDGRLWRSVTGRRWYSDQRGTTPGSQEVVLIHVKRRLALPPGLAISLRRPSA